MPYAPSPGETLLVEHGLLTRLLLAYRTVHERCSPARFWMQAGEPI